MRAHLLIVITVFAAACGDEHSHEDPDVEGCEHITEGPFTAITATTGAPGAPAIAADHMAYTVALPAAAIGNSGYVTFAADETALFIFYVDQPVTAVFTTSNGVPIAPQESSTSVAACTEVQGRHMVPLEVGTAHVQLSSATVSSVDVVVEHALEDHEH